jgi:organic radical activating enzyme
LSPFAHQINSKTVKNILRKFPEVTSLQLSGYSKLTNSEFKEIDKLCPKIEELDITSCLLDSKTFEPPTFKHLKKLICNPKYHLKYMDHFQSKKVLIVERELGNHFIVRTLLGVSYYFDCESYNISIHEVKQIFQDREGVEPNCQRLIHHGKRLEDGRLLSDYNFGYSSNVLHLVLNERNSNLKTKLSLMTEKPTKIVHVKEIKSPKRIPKIDVFQFPLMDPKSCEKIIQNDKMYSKDEIVEMIESTVLPKFEILGEFEYDIFFVEYGFEKDNDFVLHTDPSKYTLNICLEAVQLVGCEIGFLVDPILSEDEKQNILDLDQKDFKFQTFKPMTGDAFFHEGGIPHIIFPLYSGRRTNMVIWLNEKK